MLGQLWCQCSSCAYQHTKTDKYPDQDVYRWSFTNANKYTGASRHEYPNQNENPNQDVHDWSVANDHAHQDKDSYTVRDGCTDLE